MDSLTLDQVLPSLRNILNNPAVFAPLARKFKGSVRFVIPDLSQTLTIILKSKDDVRLEEGDSAEKVDLTITLPSDIFVKLISGELNPQVAFVKKMIELTGKMSLAMKLTILIKAVQKEVRLQVEGAGGRSKL